MSPAGGTLVALVGAWVLCQVFGGAALERLGVITATDQSPWLGKKLGG